MARLTDADVAAALATLPGWVRHGDEIEKTFELPTFPAAVAFVVAVADRAEAANHHPDLDLRWRRVRCALTTHDEGGLTDKDVALAREIDAAAGTVA
ncbi:MAG: 4a-hydroxytetrahydrobiopterin dehydratase [Actinobacteria bacterium]|nr:4a-hydroxytetrahydrobiopterin dehydratase [Actinomycetota bacterium]